MSYLSIILSLTTTAKQYLYSYRRNKFKSLPSIKVNNSKIKMIRQLHETMITKLTNKLKAHKIKMGQVQK